MKFFVMLTSVVSMTGLAKTVLKMVEEILETFLMHFLEAGVDVEDESVNVKRQKMSLSH